MPKYRDKLPQLSGGLFLTDGGIETSLIFHEGCDLPHSAAFWLLKDNTGSALVRRCLAAYAQVAVDQRAGLVLETVTWRASPDWGSKLGYSDETLAEANRQAVAMLEDIREEFESELTPVVISGNVGPRGDGYNPSIQMSEADAERYHAFQIETFRDSNADMIAALTLNYVEEAIGITRAAQAAAMPSAISFTVETNGQLPTGQTLKDAIQTVDLATNNAPAYYMVNCAHPTHFSDALDPDELWTKRIRAIRANSSCKSHAELDESPELDAGNPIELGQQYMKLKRRHPHLNVLGGCCGTDPRHISEIGKACAPLF